MSRRIAVVEPFGFINAMHTTEEWCKIDIKKKLKQYKTSETNHHSEGYIIDDGKEWIDSTHTPYNTKLLTMDDPKYEFSKNTKFKGTLYPPQATLLHSMIQLENTQRVVVSESAPVLNMAAPDMAVPDMVAPDMVAPDMAAPDMAALDMAALDKFDYTAHSRYGMLSVKFSFGKTVSALALICAQKYPLNTDTTFPLLSVHSDFNADRLNRMHINAKDPANCNAKYNNFTLNSEYGVFPEIAQCDDDEIFIPITMVAAASSIITQWENNIKKFTNLKYFIISDVRALKKFEQMRHNMEELLTYDIILIKVGSITGNFNVIGETRRFQLTRSILEAIRLILNSCKIARFIIDDFDVIKLTKSDYLINACFTWFISATRRQSGIKCRLYENSEPTEQLMFNNMESPAIAFTADDVLSNIFNLRCDDYYVDEHINTTEVTFRKIIVKGTATKLLHQLNISPEIIEMVNGDAIGQAAQALGLEVSSIGELINRIMGNYINNITKSIQILNRIKLLYDKINYMDAANPFEPMPTASEMTGDIPDNGETASEMTDNPNSENIINSIRKIITLLNNADYTKFIDGDMSFLDLKGKPIHISSLQKPHIEQITNLKIKMTEQYKSNSIIMDRMRDNIREGHCQCCSLPFDDNFAYILGNCCQIIICEECISIDNGTRAKKTLINRCPNCSSEINYFDKKSLIRIGENIDLGDTLSDDIYNIYECSEEKISVDSSSNKEISNMKIKALLQILESNNKIVGDYCISDDIVPPYISGLLLGVQDIPNPGINKFLIFSLLTETTHLLSKELTDRNIVHNILNGTISQKKKIISEFEFSHSNILLVTATNDCAGLHLPFVSHIIFYHKIIDPNIESQIAARGQRLGRTFNLEIISLLYEMEN